MKNSKALLASIIVALLFALFSTIGFSLTAKAAENANQTVYGQQLPPYTTAVNKEKTSGNYLQATTAYQVDDKVVMIIDIFYRLQKDGTYKAVYYNAASADGGISFSEREIADTDNVIYVDDGNLGLEKGQAVFAEIADLLDEVGYN